MMVVPSAAKIGGNSRKPEVLGRFNFLRLKGFELISAHISGVSTKPAYLLTWNCGHEICSSVQEKWVCKSYRLKKLGLLPRLGRFVTSTLIVSYAMVESILDVVALIILGSI